MNHQKIQCFCCCCSFWWFWFVGWFLVFTAIMKISPTIFQFSTVYSVLRHNCDYNRSPVDHVMVLPPPMQECCLLGVCVAQLPGTWHIAMEVTQKKTIEKSQWAAIKVKFPQECPEIMSVFQQRQHICQLDLHLKINIQGTFH